MATTKPATKPATKTTATKATAAKVDWKGKAAMLESQLGNLQGNYDALQKDHDKSRLTVEELEATNRDLVAQLTNKKAAEERARSRAQEVEDAKDRLQGLLKTENLNVEQLLNQKKSLEGSVRTLQGYLEQELKLKRDAEENLSKVPAWVRSLFGAP